MYLLTEKADTGSSIETDSITLAYAERIKSRLRVTTDHGSDAGLQLPRGTILNHGDLLRAEDGSVVRILAASEKVSSASTTDPLLLNRACYHLGNRHVVLQIMPGCVRYLHDHVLDDMVRKLGLTVKLINAPFEPEAGAYHGGDRHDH